MVLLSGRLGCRWSSDFRVSIDSSAEGQAFVPEGIVVEEAGVFCTGPGITQCFSCLFNSFYNDSVSFKRHPYFPI